MIPREFAYGLLILASPTMLRAADHWSFLPLRQPDIPVVADSTWAQSPIDYFVLARLTRAGLQPSPSADRCTLIRRVTLDLTGLPPTSAEVEVFIRDTTSQAYENLVNRLLKSPRYGEHMARFWLDAVRYGDTHGLHLDNYREIWPYRDWVIAALNNNLPFDQFVIEQIGGDLLPDATISQKIASGYNRLHITTNEGGAIEEEWYVRNVIDRVATTGTVFMGLTLGCAQCHDHKFDPISQKEFYQLFAFFNNLDGSALDKNVKNPSPVLQLPSIDQQRRLTELRQQIAEHSADASEDSESANTLEKLKKELVDFEAQVTTTLVMKERAKPRPAYLLQRGRYEARAEQVERITPAALPPMDATLPSDRLGLARWLISPDHPLPARVAVNRFWQQIFGRGIVETSEDFGSQGSPPTHPDLLDWLSWQFVSDGWDIKNLMKRMVMSATYRQDSRWTNPMGQRDPDNEFLARGPRFRLDAEMLRDQALAVSGLLVNQLGGPSVKPPQPDGLWYAVAYSDSDTVRFKADEVPDKIYRRSLYTFWKRTAPPPQMTTFDAPSRESCIMRRERTNTPLQALLLMNEVQCVEAARHLAQNAMRVAGVIPEQRARQMFLQATAREADQFELKMLVDTYKKHLQHFQREIVAAADLVNIGNTSIDAALPVDELAAWTMIGNLILNLDEVLTKG